VLSSLLALSLLAAAPARAEAPEVVLPAPRTTGGRLLDEALAARRSVRRMAGTPLTLEEVGSLLWAAQGVTDGHGHRAAPSAYGLYPLEVHLVAGAVTGLAAGVYRYAPDHHALIAEAPGDRRAALVESAIHQGWLQEAPAWFVVTAVPERTRRKLGAEGDRFVSVEVGLAAENLLLEAVSLDLGSTFVGGFDPAALGAALSLPVGEEAWAVLPVGHAR
jgi:SagB-type dehydrogenase family enzyme